VFAKSLEAKNYLQSNWSDFNKTYYAVVHGHLPEDEGIISSYLVEKGVHKMYSATNPEQKKQGKHAKTAYKVLQKNGHLSDKGCAIVGDKKYGNDGKGEKGVKRLALHAAKLSIKHPYSKRELIVEAPMPAYFKGLVGEV